MSERSTPPVWGVVPEPVRGVLQAQLSTPTPGTLADLMPDPLGQDPALATRDDGSPRKL